MNPGSGAENLRLCDAHLHLQDVPLEGDLSEAWAPIILQLTNGTCPDDWERVVGCKPPGKSRLLKAYGVHPWRVDALPGDWESRLRKHLDAGAASVGEIGLDHWIEPREDFRQREIFERQLNLAAEYNLPPSIHCLRAWGMLLDCLRSGPELRRGFLVHGFGGSREVLYELLDLGGYVSFSAYAADPRRQRMREAAKACPADRLLAETDAPDMVPPKEVCRFPLQDGEGHRLHHPGEILSAYTFLADLRGVRIEDLAGPTEENFHRLFGE